MIFQHQAMYRPSNSVDVSSLQRVALATTHCKPFDLQISEQWVLG